MISIGDARVEAEVWLYLHLWNTLPAMHIMLVGCGGCLDKACEDV